MKPEHAFAALDGARGGPVTEGNVGGGTGMICYEFKGGIGTASRIVKDEAGTYTVGVLVQANFGRRGELLVAGVPVGRVAAMTLESNHRARLTLLVDDDVLLPTDTSAAIHTDGLFGRKFVVLQPGGDETVLKADGVITFTQDSLIVSELLDLIIAEGRAQRASAQPPTDPTMP